MHVIEVKLCESVCDPETGRMKPGEIIATAQARPLPYGFEFLPGEELEIPEGRPLWIVFPSGSNALAVKAGQVEVASSGDLRAVQGIVWISEENDA